MSLVDHLIELRNRLIISLAALVVACLVCYLFAEDIYGFLVRPLADQLGPDRRMIYTGLTEAFFTYMKVAFFAGAFLCFPVIAGQIYLFVAPGLYKKEKSAFLPFLVATPILFIMGAALVYYLIFPMAWHFFLSFETAALGGTGPAIQLEQKVSEYLSLSMTLIFAFGIAFQLPVALTLLAKVGIVSSQQLASGRRFAIVGVFIAAAILTPPDVISQVGLAVPLLALYEISILLAKYVERKRAAEEAARDREFEDL
jgi:sec-independent protein translocase protein TatC